MAPPTHDEKIPKHDAPASNQDKNSPRATRRVGGRPTTYNGPDGCGDESGATLLGDSIQEGPSPRRDRAHHRRSVSPSLRRWLQDEDEEPFRASVMPAAISQFHGGTQNMPGPLAWEPQTGQQGADSDSGTRPGFAENETDLLKDQQIFRFHAPETSEEKRRPRKADNSTQH